MPDAVSRMPLKDSTRRFARSGHSARVRSPMSVIDSCRPVIVVAERMAESLSPGAALALDVHVVSDVRLTGFFGYEGLDFIRFV